MTYEMDIAGLKRDLPLCKVSDDLYIGAFVMFGDVELTVHCAAELLKLTPEYGNLFTVNVAKCATIITRRHSIFPRKTVLCIVLI